VQHSLSQEVSWALLPRTRAKEKSETMVHHTYATDMPETVRALLEKSPEIEEEQLEIWMPPEDESPGVFYATVKVYDGVLKIMTRGAESKKVTVPRMLRPPLESEPGIWKMCILDEKNNHIFAKPIELIQRSNEEVKNEK